MSRTDKRTKGQEAAETGDRIAGRFASLSPSQSPQVTSDSVHLAAPTDGASGTISMPRKRVSRRGLLTIAESLKPRAWKVLESVATHRYLDVNQIRRLHFADLSPISSARLTQKTLQSLRQDRLLGTLDRRVGGISSGSTSLVHYLDVVGYRLLQQEGLAVRRPAKDPTDTFLKHTHDVAETHLRLVEADRRGELELVRCQLEPECWRSYLRFGGTRVRLKPDLYIEIALTRGSKVVEGFFVEVDLGTESNPRLIVKCHEYQAYERTGAEQGDDGENEFPPVIWSMAHRNMATAEKRRRRLRDAIEQEPKLDSSLFHVIAPDQIINLLMKGGVT